MDMQNVSNLQISEGAVRTIHDKDNRLIWGRVAYDTKYAGNTVQDGTPTPDTPVPVQVVTGEQTVTVGDGVDSQNYLISLNIGNMAPMSDFQVGGMNSGNPSPSVKHQVNNAGHPIKVSPNTQYTISVKLGDTVKGMRVGIHSCDADLTFISDSGWKQLVPSAYTFTTGANVEYVKLIFSLSTTSSTVTTGSTQDTTQFTSASEWFRGATIKMNPGPSVIPDIEIYKIGDYQDYIYKSGDDWYVHKECSKYTFTGSETGQIYSPTSTYTEARFYGNYGEIGPTSNKTTISTKFAYLNNNRVAVISGYNSNNWYVRIPSSFNVTTLEEMRTYVTNNTTYYPLATPTDTQIADATLIGQLNAIHEWMTRYGYNATVTGNLPIIIDRTNL